MNKLLFSVLTLAVLAATAIAQVPKKKAPAGASVYFLSPKDGETVSSPVTVRFGLKGMGVAPAGVDQPNTGHHHLLVDMPKDPDLDAALPVTDNIRHFGAGQTETELTLPPLDPSSPDASSSDGGADADAASSP